MVNGALSKILYIGTFVMIAMCIVGYILLAMNGKSAPAELQMALVAAFAMITGTHITPPNVQKTTNGSMVEPAATYELKREME